jgi:endoglucanase
MNKQHLVAAGVALGIATACPQALAGLPFVGTSLSGAEWNVNTGGVTRGGYHVYPDSHFVPGYDSPATLAKAGMTIFRFPIDWENVQPALNQPFDTAEFQKVETTVSDLTALGAVVLIDLHNYARYDGSTVGSAQVPDAAFADFWSRMAQAYANDPLVAFDLMNEPHDLPTEQWAGAANAAIAAIRAAGAKNLVFVEGNGWTGAESWPSNWYGTPDATVMLTITDPADNYVFEAHQYLDPQSTGGSDTCAGATIGSERMQPFTDWLRQNHRRGFLGEFNGGANATCFAALTDLLDYLDANADVYIGWTFWASGPEWGSSSRVLEPGRADYGQYMQVLAPHLGGAPKPAQAIDADAGSDAEAGASNGADAGRLADAGFAQPAQQQVEDSVDAGDMGPGNAEQPNAASRGAGCSAAPGKPDAHGLVAVLAALSMALRFRRNCTAADARRRM